MNNNLKKKLAIVLIFIAVIAFLRFDENRGGHLAENLLSIFGITNTDGGENNTSPVSDPSPDIEIIDERGSYDSKDDVSLYIHTYGHLPDNYITKDEAESLGWSGGSVENYAPGKCIGGSYFGNYEKLLPSKNGRSYYECDIDTLGSSSRGSKRIIYSNDGLIYYTDDHYESFTLLYGEP